MSRRPGLPWSQEQHPALVSGIPVSICGRPQPFQPDSSLFSLKHLALQPNGMSHHTLVLFTARNVPVPSSRCPSHPLPLALGPTCVALLSGTRPLAFSSKFSPSFLNYLWSTYDVLSSMVAAGNSQMDQTGSPPSGNSYLVFME